MCGLCACVCLRVRVWAYACVCVDLWSSTCPGRGVSVRVLRGRRGLDSLCMRVCVRKSQHTTTPGGANARREIERKERRKEQISGMLAHIHALGPPFSAHTFWDCLRFRYADTMCANTRPGSKPAAPASA